MGRLEVDSAQQRRFDFDDREFLCGFAEILGRTIENRQQLEQARQLGLDQRVALQERETLFRELQHRVANQLHLIIGSLQLASRRIFDPDAQRAIQHITERAISIAQRHEQLSLTQVEREISLHAFIQRLIQTFIIPNHIVLESRIEDAPTRIGTAVRLGLIINELITNSLKHAFAESGGMISITLTVNQKTGEATLMMSDNGTGIGERPTTGMGMGLIRTLSNDIGGIPEWARAEGRGTTFTLTFPLDR